MHRIAPNQLVAIACELFKASGCSPEDAGVVANHLVDSSLYGHDSHGMIRIYEYVAQIKEGIFHPAGQPRIVTEKPCTAIVDGGACMGPVAAEFATKIALEKAGEHALQR